jgi:membrane-associated phospholipid phosphatase
MSTPFAAAGRQCSVHALSFWRELRFLLFSCWREKLLLTSALNLFFWLPYSWLSRHALFPLRGIPQTWLDLQVGYSPEPWSWIYLSQFLYTATIPWLIVSKSNLHKYVVGLAIMCTASFLVFLFFPVRGPRPGSFAVGAASAFIAQYDGPLSTFPSLHAAFMIYTCLLGWRLFRPRLPAAVAFVFVIWGVLILYATLAIKQHYAWDLVVGALLGYLSDRVAWREPERCRAASNTLSSKEEMSQPGDK